MFSIVDVVVGVAANSCGVGVVHTSEFVVLVVVVDEGGGIVVSILLAVRFLARVRFNAGVAVGCCSIVETTGDVATGGAGHLALMIRRRLDCVLVLISLSTFSA